MTKQEMINKVVQLERETYDIYYEMRNYREEMDDKTKLAYVVWSKLDDLLTELSITFGIDIED